MEIGYGGNIPIISVYCLCVLGEVEGWFLVRKVINDLIAVLRVKFLDHGGHGVPRRTRGNSKFESPPCSPWYSLSSVTKILRLE
jgi:hypothetical protein